MPVLPFTALTEARIKNIFEIAIWNVIFDVAMLNCIFFRRTFWGSNVKAFWKAFFEGTITLGNWLK